jgi:hypothetical protein
MKTKPRRLWQLRSGPGVGKHQEPTMPANAEVINRLREFGTNIEKWRKASEGFRRLADEAVATKKVDEDRLLELERTTTDIYEEITTFNKLVPEIATESPNAAAELAAVGEALHMVLLDITETGTRMYSVRSVEVTPGATTGPSTKKAVAMPSTINPEAPTPPPPPPAPHDPHPADEDAENVYNPSPGGDDRSEQKDRSIDRLRKDDPGSPA